MSTMPNELRLNFAALQRRALLVAMGGALIAAIGLLFNVRAFLNAYLVAYLFWLQFPLGGMAVLMLHHLSGGNWGFLVRRPLEAAMRTLPLMALLMVPLLFALPQIYPWAQSGAVEHDPALQHKSAYLNVPFFLLRTAMYFGVWITVALLLIVWSHRQDGSDDPALLSRLRHLSGPGLALYGVTGTFAMIDWVMSLDPHWYSTIFGLLMLCGQVLAAFAFGIVIVSWLARYTPMSQIAAPAHLRDLGNLLLAFVMVWAYLAFSQYLITWSGNLPEETVWYVHRTFTGWKWIALVLIVAHFALPFLLLLSRDVKGNTRTLVPVAVLILIMRFVDLLWVLKPAMESASGRMHWLDFVLVAAIGGIWVAAFTWRLRQRPLVPLNDPRLVESGSHAEAA